jgi:hypothetical protein
MKTPLDAGTSTKTDRTPGKSKRVVTISLTELETFQADKQKREKWISMPPNIQAQLQPFLP